MFIFLAFLFCFADSRIKSAGYTKVRGRSRIVDGEFKAERTFAGSFHRGAVNEVVQEEAPNTASRWDQSLGRSRGSSTRTCVSNFITQCLSRKFTPHCYRPGGQRKEFVSRCVNSLLPPPPPLPHPTDSLSYLLSGVSSRVLLPWSWGHTADFATPQSFAAA